MSNKLVNSLIWGLGRGIGNTASKRTTDYIGSKILSPKSKFRKHIDKFNMGGNFNSARNKLFTLIEMFHEEYVLNCENLPLMQVSTYLKGDIEFIEQKINSLEFFITSDSQETNLVYINNYWGNVKSKI